ncbi:LOW QUALITY PROTEIN: hypothetical protein YC2023_083321 [Brassica napus]
MQKDHTHPYESNMYKPHDVRPRRSRPAARSFHQQQYLDDPSPFTPEGRYSETHARGKDYERCGRTFHHLCTLMGAADSGSVDVLPWIPTTVSAVALRLSELDASIIYVKPSQRKLS